MKDKELQLNKTCNNDCVICNSLKFKNKKDLTLNEVKNELERIRKQDVAVTICGGDPAIRKDIMEIIKYAKLLGFVTITLRSNGRVFAYKDFCKAIVDAGVDNFEIYLYGDKAKTHDSITKVPGSFEQTLKGIKNLKELGKYVIVKIIILKENYRRLSEITDMLIGLNVDLILMRYLDPKKHKSNHCVEMSREVMDEITRALDKKYERYNWDGLIYVGESN